MFHDKVLCKESVAKDDVRRVALAFQLFKFIFNTFVGVAMLPTATHIFQWPMRMKRDRDVAMVLAFTSVTIKVTGYMTCIVRRTCLLVWRISVLNKNKHTKNSCLVHLDSSDFRLLQI